jgi:eukaryotic-like serine/threonine-protein kinase
MVTKSGVKLLDFGIAKLRSHRPAADETVALTPITQQGVVLGTLQYTAPEQVEGRDADARADIFAFGVVLYEMVTGRPAFEGRSPASLIASILTMQPPAIRSLQPVYPVALERLIESCLAKDPAERWQNVGDLKRVLSGISDGLSAVGLSASPKRGTRQTLLMISGAVAVLVAITAVWYALAKRSPTAEAHTAILEIALPDPQTLLSETPRLSPDGRYLAMVAERIGTSSSVWIRAMDSPRAQELPGTQGGYDAFWSPDSRQLAYYTEGELRRIAIDGGSPQTICQIRSGVGGSWGRNGTILFSSIYDGAIHSISATGGEVRRITALDPSRAETGHFYPLFLADGKHFLYTATSSRPEYRAIRIRSIESGEDRILVNGRANAEISAGYLLFWGGNSLLVQPFDEKKLQLRGEARPLTDAVLFDNTFPFAVRVSAFRERLLAYRTFQPEQTTRLVWYDRQGKELGTLGEPAHYSNPALSPDGSNLAIGVADPKTGSRDLWTFDLARGSRSRLTFDPGDESNPVWSPDSSRIAFSSSRRGAATST